MSLVLSGTRYGVHRYRKVVDDDLGHLYCFLEAGGGGHEGADDLLRCFSGAGKVVKGGVGCGKQLYIFVAKDSHLPN